jgi:hypothetical protein
MPVAAMLSGAVHQPVDLALGEVAPLDCQVYDAWCAFLGCRFHADKLCLRVTDCLAQTLFLHSGKGTQASPRRQIGGPARGVAQPGWACVCEPPGGRARENRKFIQAPSPEIWSETISGGEEVLAGKWGGLFLGYLLGKIFGGAIAIISFRLGGWMQQSAVPRCAILAVGSTGGIGQ